MTSSHDPRLDFETLIVGAANRLAVSAAHAVAESPGTVYNPLFVYGDSGLGKTHILCAIATLVRERQPAATVEYITLVELVDGYHVAVAHGDTDAWAAQHQRFDALLVDDIQFLTGRRETQSDLLRLFTSMQEQDRQLVLASDRPPSDIADVDERLIARFSGGLVVDIGAPDYETRAAILRATARQRSIAIDDSLLDDIARIEFSNVRELQGALNRVVAHRALGGAEMRAEDVAQSFGMEMPGPRRRRSVDAFRSYLAGLPTPPSTPETEIATRFAAAIVRWKSEGFRIAGLEREREHLTAESVDMVLDAFAKRVEQLRSLERRAAAVDYSLASNPLFRDPDRLADAEELVTKALSGDLPPPGPRPGFARELFDVSTSNSLAVSAADAVIADAGTRFNPLLVHGPSGVGKTHLVHAIGNALASSGGTSRVVACVTSRRFVDELIAAIGAGSVDRWRAHYRAVDVLIIEDVQALAGKERSQEELFHVFNSLHAAGKQLIFSSDQPPRRIRDLEDRLRSRFDAGLVVGIDMPDRTLRERIIARALGQHGVAPDVDLVRAIADKVAGNARDVITAVHRLAVSAETQGAVLSAGFVRGDAPARRLTPVRPSMRAVDSTFLDREKVVWEWPDPGARIIEELR